MLDGPSFVQLISAIAWPITVIFIALAFRQEIRHTANRLSSLSYKDVRADFEYGLNKVEKEVRELASKGPGTSGDRVENKETYDSYERLRRIADISPRAAVMESWHYIEVATKQVADAYGVSSQGQIAGIKSIRELVGLHLLPEIVISLYESMRRLRNRAAHSEGFAITSEEAERYLDTAYRLYNALLLLLQQAEVQHEKNSA